MTDEDQGKSGDVIKAEVGEHAQNVVTGNGNIQIVFQGGEPPARPLETTLAFPTASEDEVLIVIPRFHVAQGVASSEIQTLIANAINQMANDSKISNLRVEVHDTSFGADTREKAKKKAMALGELFNASMVIWGAETRVNVEVNYLNLREPDFPAADERLGDSLANIAALSSPEPYAYYVTERLTPHISFLSLFAIGHSYYVEGEYAHALTTIEGAVSSLSSDRSPVEGLADAYFRLGWLYHIPEENRNLEKAIDNYTTAIVLNPKNTKSYNNRGNAYHAQGKYGEAIDDYTQAIKLDSNNAIVYNNRGNAYADLGEYNKAIDDFTQAIALDPNLVFAYIHRGVAYQKQGEYDKAIDDYSQAIDLDPNNAIVYNNRGNAYSDLGEHKKGIDDYSQAIELAPTCVLFYNNRGNAYNIKAKFKLALVDFDEAIKLNSEYALAYNGRGNAYLGQEEYDKAIADYDRAIALDPNYVQPYYNRGNAYADQRKYEKAITDFNKAIELDSSFALAYNNRGRVYYAQEKYDLAIANYQRVLEIDGLSENDRQFTEQRIRELEGGE